MEIDPELVVPDPSLSIGEGALAPWAGSTSQYYEQITQAIAEKYGIDLEAPWESLDEDVRDLFLYGTNGDRIEVSYRNRYGRKRSYATRFEGIVPNLERRYRETDSDLAREKIEEFMSLRPCPACKGARLKPESRAVLVGGVAIHEFTALSVKRALQWLADVQLTETERHIARLIMREIDERLRFLDNVGIGYLSMDRAAATLSGGEAQRIRLATQIGSALVGVLYVLDEPSIGLHQRDNSKLIATLERLRDARQHGARRRARRADDARGRPPRRPRPGRRRARRADHRRGHRGARSRRSTESLTGQFLAGTRTIAGPGEAAHADRLHRDPRRQAAQPQVARRQRPAGRADVRHRRVGLGQVDAGQRGPVQGGRQPPAPRAPARRARTRRCWGSTQLDKIIQVDQSPIGRTPRSNPATYTGLFDVIRDLFSKTQEARARGYKPGRFSFNVKGGRCEVCRGDGQIKIEMHFLPDVYVPCEQCHGKRYNKETLDIRFKGKTIADVLDMPVEEAVVFFEHIPKIRRRLETLNAVGLGYIRLGQPATTLSGGEAQRVKLATELSKVATGSTLYILDEPTTGLHFADVERLLDVLHRLVDQGNSVVVIEHNLDVIKTADRIIDMGPEGGEDGGEVIASGTPEEVAGTPGSYTGEFLQTLVEPAAPKARRGHGQAQAPRGRDGLSRDAAAP